MDCLAAGVYRGDGELVGDVRDYWLDGNMVGGGATEWDDGGELGGSMDQVQNCGELKGITKGELSPWSPLQTMRSGNRKELVGVRDWHVHTRGVSKDGTGYFRRDVLLVFEMRLFFCRKKR